MRVSRTHRAFVLGVLTVVSVAIVGGVLLRTSQTARAQLGIPQVVIDPTVLQQLQQKTILDKIKDIADKVAKQAEKALKTATDVAFKNALKVYLGKIAEDTATWVASAGTGQKPLFLTDPQYFANLNDAAAGDFLDTIAKDTFGVSLCDPGLAKTQIDIAIRVNLNPNFCQEACQKNFNSGMNDEKIIVPAAHITRMNNVSLTAARSIIQALELKNPASEDTTVDTSDLEDLGIQAQAACTPLATVLDCIAAYQSALSQGEEKVKSDLLICKNLCSARRRTAQCSYTQLKDNLHNLQSKEVFAELPNIFDPKNNELGQYLILTQETGEAARKAVEQEKLVRSDAYDLGPVTTAFGVGIKTPASITRQAAQEGLSVQNAGSPFGVYTGSPVADAIGIFTNTLSKKLLERIFNQGLVNPTSLSTVFNQFGGSTGGVAAAKERFASLATLNVGSGGPVDILGRLASCAIDAAVITPTTLGQVTAESCVIDESFRRAIEERLTVKQALDQGLLSDQKPFGFLANGQEPTYLNGYPYRSMVILRKNRIIPVGWELAAQFVRDVSKQNTTLRTMMEKYNDPASPFYKLVDPNWVLKAPETMCVRTGFVEETVSNEYVDDDGDEGGKRITNFSVRYCSSNSEANFGKECTCAETTPDNTSCYSETCDLKATTEQTSTCAFITPRVQQIQRREACIDEQTCIQENDDGSCKTYGTCVEEKNTWKFNGKSCDPQNATCQTYIDAAGVSATYLGNTLQTSICGANNAGCTQYCTSFDYATQQWTCTSATDPANTIRLDRDAVPCDVTSEGCTAFIRQTTGTNLLVNSGFELSTPRTTPAGSADFQGWGVGNGTQACGATAAVTTGANGSPQAAKVTWQDDNATCSGEHYMYNGVDVGTAMANKAYTTSFTARGVGASCANVTVEYQTGGPRYGVNWEYAPASAAGITADWQRFTYTYTWPDSAVTQRSQNIVVAFRLPDNGCELYLDDVQLEPGESATAYKEYAQANVIHLKRPPSEPGNNLGCTGNPATDPAACEKFARKCEAENVGCELYTPADGSSAVPGIAGQSCPADMVGCQSFREQPVTGIFPDHDARTGKYCKPANGAPNFAFISCTDDTDCGGVGGACQPLVSFVAQSGTQCTAADVGCEAYTNLDEVAAGGEGKAAFITPKLCVPPGSNAAVADFFSWEGSNENGYQLKKFRFVQSNLNPSAPCTNLQVNTTAGTPFVCIDTATTVTDCQGEYGTNLDCTEFYDNAGNITYRLRSLVVEESVSCKPFRNATDELVYYFDEGKSKSCSQAAAGCREYVGNTGSNIRTVLNSTFEGGSFAPWSGGIISTESIQFGGHSLLFSGANRANLMATSAGGGAPTSLLQEGKTYTLTYWAKKQNSNDTVEVTGYLMYGSANVGARFGGQFLSNDWRKYSVGPVTFTRSGSAVTVDDLLLENNAGGAAFFIDNIILTEVTDSIYRIKGSQKDCGGFEGCQAYTNRGGQTSTFQDFTKLCKTEKVGCEALINTQNSLRTPFAQTNTVSSVRGDVDGNGKVDQNDVQYMLNYIFSGGPPPNPLVAGDADGTGVITLNDVSAINSLVTAGTAISPDPLPGDEIITPADVVEYWVNDPQKACRPEDKACRALGRESVALQIGATASDVTLTLQGAQTQYLKNDPDAYEQILCSQQALRCEEFKTPEGSTAYFKNPVNNVCDYDAASQRWKLRGSGKVCPTQRIDNVPPGVPYGGFAGTCPGDQSGCTGYLDPVGQGDNLVVNGTFESTESVASLAAPATQPTPPLNATPDTKPQGWVAGQWSLQEYKDFPDSAGASGKAVRALGSDTYGWMGQPVNLMTNQMYVMSADIMQHTGNTTPATVELWACTYNSTSGTVEIPIYTPDNSVSLITMPQSTHYGVTLNAPASKLSDTEFHRFSGRFIAVLPSNPDASVPIRCSTFSIYGRADGQWFDNISITPTTITTVLRQSVDTTSCNGEVNAAEGCKLFNDRSSANLTYDVDGSPIGSEPTDPDAKGAPKSCASIDGDCDSNVLLKVKQDRVCKAWLSPTTTVESTKPSGEKQNLTLQLSTCSKIGPNGECQQFVSEKRCVNNPRQTCTVDTDCPATGGVRKCEPFTQTANELRCSNYLKNSCSVNNDCRTCSNDPYRLCGSNGDCNFTGSGGTSGTCGFQNGAQCLGSAYKVEDFHNNTGAVQVGAIWRTCSNNATKSCLTSTDCGVGPRTCTRGLVGVPCLADTQCNLTGPTGPIPGSGVCGPATTLGSCVVKNSLIGTYPYGSAPQTGAEAAPVTNEILNGNFQSTTTVAGSGWALEGTAVAEGSTARIVTSEVKQAGNAVAPVEVDPYLEVNPAKIPENPTSAQQYCSNSGATLVACASNAVCTGLGTPGYCGLPLHCAKNPGTACTNNLQCGSDDVCVGTNYIGVRTQPSVLRDRLSGSRGYMVSFRARYLEEPPAGARRDVEVGISNGSSTGGYSTWYDNVDLTTEWKEYTVGPFELCRSKVENPGDPAVPCLGNHVTWDLGSTGHQVFDPEKGFLYFVLAGSSKGDNNTNPPVNRNRTPFALDSISLLPVLQVSDSGGKEFVPRTCRAYPDATAMSCSYTDDTGTTHAGWQGYCVETDPKNPNTCLQWLPIDLPAGEKNIFTSVEQAGYKQRNPLYLCTESTPASVIPLDCNALIADGSSMLMDNGARCTDALLGGAGRDVIQKTYSFAPTPVAGMKLENVERVILTVGRAENDDWPKGSQFYLDASGGSHVADSVSTPTEPEKNQPWTMFWCGGNDEQKNHECGKLSYTVNFNGANDRDFNHYTSSASRCGDLGGSSDNTNLFFVQMQCRNGAGQTGECEGSFNILDHFTAGLCDSSGGTGYAEIRATVITRSICTNIVQVVENGGSNAAWSSRVSTTSTFVTPGFGYRFLQDTKPFGSILAPAQNESVPELWDSSVEPGQQPIVVKNNLKTASVARAGSAYGCSGAGCASRVCSTTGAACNTNQEIRDCQNKDGFCLGTGTVKVCQSGGKAGKVCDADSECGSTTQSVCTNGMFQGQVCVANTQCPISLFPAIYGTCGPQTTTLNKCDYGSSQTYGGGKYTSTAPIPTQDDRLDRLKLLFAKAYREWTWNSTFQRYGEVTNTPASTIIDDWNTVDDVGSRTSFKKMHLCAQPGVNSPYNRADSNLSLAYCGMLPKITNGTLNGVGGTVDITSGQSVQLRFNTVVDNEQLPLRSIAIDWDGDYRADEIIPWDAAPKSDPAKPHIFAHAYMGTSGTIFHPRIQIIDNWGWTTQNITSPYNRLPTIKPQAGSFPFDSDSDPKDQTYWFNQNNQLTIRIR
ncbi:MAG: hypothetical protein WC786_01160 [Patescibacteria group bacterium]|jgi:hypothetical protein